MPHHNKIVVGFVSLIQGGFFWGRSWACSHCVPGFLFLLFLPSKELLHTKLISNSAGRSVNPRVYGCARVSVWPCDELVQGATSPPPSGDKERETSGERKWMDGWMLNCYSWIYFFLKTVVSDLSLFPHVYSKQLTSTDEILSLVISED